jgi:hypothetical protein
LRGVADQFARGPSGRKNPVSKVREFRIGRVIMEWAYRCVADR